MGRYSEFDYLVRSDSPLKTTYREAIAAGGGRILLEDGDFVFDPKDFPDRDPGVEIYLGSGACLEVWGGLVPNVQLTLPGEYVESLERDSALSEFSLTRTLFWSSATAPNGLEDPSQDPEGLLDLTLYVPEGLRTRYYGDRPVSARPFVRNALAVWNYSEPLTEEPSAPERPASEAVRSPRHYTWLGQSLAALGLSDAANVEAWDVLDAAFPQDPLLWNAGKYLLRQGRKGGEEKRLEDLRKARQYLDRQIAHLSRGGE
nr:MAG TPA: nucelotide kinase [Caudoviricetes sp.]